MRIGERHVLRLLILACLICGVSSSIAGSAQGADDRLDLAGAALSPIDLELVGLAGFGVDQAYWADWEESLSVVADQLDVEDRDIEDSFDDRAGFLFGYDYQMSVESGDGSEEIEVRSTLLQFDTDNAAGDAFDVLTGEVDRELISDAVSGNWGDVSSTFQRETSYVVVFRQDQILSQISMESDFLDESDFVEVLAARMASLVTIAQENILAILAGEGPGFGITAVRFEIEGPDRIAGTDRYLVEGGRFIAATDEDVTFAAFQNIQIDSFGMLSSYQRFLYPLNLDDAIVRITIIQHSSVNLAASYVDFTRDRLDFGGGYQELQPEEMQLPGDAAIAYAYTIQYTDEFITEGIALVIQNGDVTISMEIDGPDGVDPDAVAEIAQMQVSCLNGDTCETVPYPGDEDGEDNRSSDLLNAR